MWKSILVLMGPPGSGKTTIGNRVSLLDNEIFFVSVGSYMRDKLLLKPPFEGVDRNAVFEKILFEEFLVSGKSNLIIDCNPFPTEMWSAVLKHFSRFERQYICKITAESGVLQNRLDSRQRNDYAFFSNKERLTYYFTYAEPEIKKLESQKPIMHLENNTETDLKKCIDAIIKIYEPY